ncbi:hypothetical protein QJS66_21770 [Kocuria rhizophila]|nr:hypothetical protein QJS66_21770 [Kocuria rhizophila]
MTTLSHRHLDAAVTALHTGQACVIAGRPGAGDRGGESVRREGLSRKVHRVHRTSRAI